MKRTVFYSWQSDLPGKTNRNLIEKSLERAIRTLSREEDAGLEPVLDRDTANLDGSPDIAHSILGKIAVADVFVADVSIINNEKTTRPTPNPNVLIELGYAVAELGWENVVLVMNTAFGGPELLPFDLRGRRVITYALKVEEEPAKARDTLQRTLESSLRNALSDGLKSNLPTGEKGHLWWGRWNFDHSASRGGRLFIREVGSNGFLFELGVFNGSHLGQISSYARILSADLAYCRLDNGPDYPHGELIFRRSQNNGERLISIEEPARCFSWGGMRAHFGGTFRWQLEPWFERGFLNELELARLYSLTGKHMDIIRACTADLMEERSVAEAQIRVFRGGVPGLYTIAESIVMVDDNGRMWAAYLSDSTIHYFTNVAEDEKTLPKDIDEWRERFKQSPVIFCGLPQKFPEYL